MLRLCRRRCDGSGPAGPRDPAMPVPWTLVCIASGPFFSCRLGRTTPSPSYCCPSTRTVLFPMLYRICIAMRGRVASAVLPATRPAITTSSSSAAVGPGGVRYPKCLAVPRRLLVLFTSVSHLGCHGRTCTWLGTSLPMCTASSSNQSMFKAIRCFFHALP